MLSFLTMFAEASAATRIISDYVTPLMQLLGGLGSVVAIAALVIGGFNYATAAGDPEKIDRAKNIIKRAAIGLVLLIAATTLTGILHHAYSSPPAASSTLNLTIPNEPPDSGESAVAKIIIEGVSGLIKSIINSVGKPIITALAYFTTSTPTVANNQPVFNLWLVVLAIANGLFVLMVIVIGFHVMSSSIFGFEDMDLRQLLPRFALTFVAMNASIFGIDMLIGLSNAMVSAIANGFDAPPIWDLLNKLFTLSSATGVAVLLIMVAFLIVGLILLVYYLGRLVTIFLGAVLSPVVVLMWLLPSFRDLANTLARTYIGTIFVLFVHIVILKLSSAVLLGMYFTNGGGDIQPLLPLGIGLATLLSLLKVEGVMSQYMAAAVAPRAMRNISRQLVGSSRSFIKGTKTVGTSRPVKAAAKKGVEVAGKGAAATKIAAGTAAKQAKRGAATASTAAILGTASPMVQRQKTEPTFTPVAKTRTVKINRRPYKLATFDKKDKQNG